MKVLTKKWAEKHEQGQELRALQRKHGEYKSKQNELLAQLEAARESFHSKYVR